MAANTSKAHNTKVNRERGAMNLVKLVEQFNSEDRCRDYLEALRWPNGVRCPECGFQSVSRIKTRNQYDCNKCRTRFSVKSGTVFHDSHLPLWKWFLAIYLMIESKKGISANQVKRTLDCTYKTAWYLCHRIRFAMRQVSADRLRGIVEIDETYIGGVAHGHGNAFKNKICVVGAVQRGGEIRLQVLKARGSANRFSLKKFIADNTAPDTEAIYTDDYI